MVSKEALVSYKQKLVDDDFTVEYEVLPFFRHQIDLQSSRKSEICDAISDIDNRVELIENEVAKLNSEIERLTNHADWLDYTVAVSSGILCGMIDSIFVGEWNFQKAKAISNEEINRKVIEFAKKQGWTPHEGNGERLDLAIKSLEKKYPLPGDGAFEQLINSGITKKTHHLDDFCHHPNIVGLVCCLLVQFRGESINFNNESTNFSIPVEINEYGQLQGKNVVTKFFCGIINWFINVSKTVANAKGHWMSDIAGSGTSKHGGAGLPGPIMSLLKECSALPCFKNSDFAEELRKLYQNGIGSGKKQIDLGVFNSLFEGASSKFDMRTENAIKHELKRQSVPVLLNEAIVRGFYTIRHFISEYKEKKSLDRLEWKKIIPFKNRTIVRMLTISSGTFTTIDLADAAVRSAVKNVGQVESPTFWKDFILRVNFVGIGRFAIAIGTDVGMGMKKSALENKRMVLMSEQIELLNARVFYYQENMWIQIDATEQSLEGLEKYIEYSANVFSDSYSDIERSIGNIGKYIPGIEKKNPGLKKQLLDAMW